MRHHQGRHGPCDWVRSLQLVCYQATHQLLIYAPHRPCCRSSVNAAGMELHHCQCTSNKKGTSWSRDFTGAEPANEQGSHWQPAVDNKQGACQVCHKVMKQSAIIPDSADATLI